MALPLRYCCLAEQDMFVSTAPVRSTSLWWWIPGIPRSGPVAWICGIDPWDHQSYCKVNNVALGRPQKFPIPGIRNPQTMRARGPAGVIKNLNCRFGALLDY